MTYPMSRDYHRLKELLLSGSTVVCFTDFKVDGLKYRDVCLGYYFSVAGEFVFKVRGMLYCSFSERMVGIQKGYPESFEEMMRLHNIEYIDVI